MQENPDIPAISDDDALTQLHPNHIKVLRIKTIMASLPILIAALILESSAILPPAFIMAPVALLVVLVILRLPLRRHLARGYAISADRLRVVRGIWMRRDTVVPFSRVQHIDVNQGPIERFYGIATLTLYTAGMHNASVNLPGLGEDLARQMREDIRQHIKRESV